MTCTCATSLHLSPIATFGPITQYGPISTSAPITAVGAILAEGSIASILPLRLDQHRADFRFGYEFAGDLRLGEIPPHVFPARFLFHVILDHVAGHDRFAEF